MRCARLPRCAKVCIRIGALNGRLFGYTMALFYAPCDAGLEIRIVFDCVRDHGYWKKGGRIGLRRVNTASTLRAYRR
jgi:hypothetical protein